MKKKINLLTQNVLEDTDGVQCILLVGQLALLPSLSADVHSMVMVLFVNSGTWGTVKDFADCFGKEK